MKTQAVALLKGINLGKRRVAMTRLVALFEELGLTAVRSFIASGNILFTLPKGSREALEKRIEDHLHKNLGYTVETFIRTEKEIQEVLGEPAFPDQDDKGITLHVAFLKTPLAPALAKGLKRIQSDLDSFHVKGREFYWRVASDRSSDSKIWASPEMRALKLPVATQRSRVSLGKLSAAFSKE